MCAAATVAAGGCDNRGFFTEDSWGLRAKGLRAKVSATFENVGISGLSLLPSIEYIWDISGNSYDLTIQDGRQFAILAMRAEFQNVFANSSYEPVWGGDYFWLRDRSTVSGVIGVKF